MFAVPPTRSLPIIERSPAVARELASRARHRVPGTTTVPDTPWPASDSLSTTTSPPRTAVTWLHCWRCSTRMPCACWSGGSVRVRQAKSEVRQRWPGPSPVGLAVRKPRW